jgi:hypothetical protein
MAADTKNYEALHKKYAEAAKAGKPEKKQIMLDIIQIEREAARGGEILSYEHVSGGQYATKVQNTRSKRSLQEQYVDSFNDEAKVMLPHPLKGGEPRPTTMREYHRERLLSR